MRKQRTYKENRIFPYADMEELEDELFIRVRKIVSNMRLDHSWTSMDNMDILKSAGIFKGSDYGITRNYSCRYFDFRK